MALGTSKVHQLLQAYASSSGQSVNFAKSSVNFSSNVSSSNRGDVERILGVRTADNLERYLGLPCMVGRDRKRAFASIRGRIRSRFLLGVRDSYQWVDVKSLSSRCFRQSRLMQ